MADPAQNRAAADRDGPRLDPVALLARLQERKAEMVQRLREIVESESPSNNKAAVDRLGQRLGALFESAGGRIKFHRSDNFGDHLQVDFAGDSSHKPVLLLGHFDTVWDVGTLSTMPFRVDNSRAFGPGSFDMKAGIVQGLFAIETLRQGGLPRPLTVFLVTDEEVGSDSSRAITEELARKSAAVLVLEPSHGPEGALKTSRKGVGDFTVTVHGVAAHSGLDFEKGQSAIIELAHQITAIEKFTDVERGLTVNPGIIEGGTRTNVIAAVATAYVDARIQRLQDAPYVEQLFRSLKPVNPRCTLEVSGAINRPPLERTEAVAALFEQAKGIAKALGWKLTEAAVGGGSDGNFTGALGIPTLDGLGALGEGAHAVNESVVIDEMPRRAALVASLIAHID
ncbi:MAG: M20 family metallopeptidase [Acidobacteriaceae bacterium]|nr:M20 family metallopeptidase [Acidobacteriaceae bacterium]